MYVHLGKFFLSEDNVLLLLQKKRGETGTGHTCIISNSNVEASMSMQSWINPSTIMNLHAVMAFCMSKILHQTICCDPAGGGKGSDRQKPKEQVESQVMASWSVKHLLSAFTVQLCTYMHLGPFHIGDT